jgi:hypothetical protein
MASSVLIEFAQELLLHGKDRMPYRFDRRSEERLLRSGLLRYPDGTYSVSDALMERAIDWWGLVAKDPSIQADGRAKMNRLIALAKRWQEPKPIAADMRFGKLTHAQYTALWDLALRRDRPVWLHEPDMSQKSRAIWKALEKHGYVTLKLNNQTLTIEPTPEGDRLVSEIGSARQLLASYDFRPV